MQGRNYQSILRILVSDDSSSCCHWVFIQLLSFLDKSTESTTENHHQIRYNTTLKKYRLSFVHESGNQIVRPLFLWNEYQYRELQSLRYMMGLSFIIHGEWRYRSCSDGYQCKSLCQSFLFRTKAFLTTILTEKTKDQCRGRTRQIEEIRTLIRNHTFYSTLLTSM